MMQRWSVFIEGQKEANRFKWIESEKAGRDLGEEAIQKWICQHWNGFLRAKWLEHLEGRNFWIELDRNDFGLLRQDFQDKALLLERILDRLKCGKENLDIIQWAVHGGINCEHVIQILEMLDINSRRLACRFVF